MEHEDPVTACFFDYRLREALSPAILIGVASHRPDWSYSIQLPVDASRTHVSSVEDRIHVSEGLEGRVSNHAVRIGDQSDADLTGSDHINHSFRYVLFDLSYKICQMGLIRRRR